MHYLSFYDGRESSGNKKGITSQIESAGKDSPTEGMRNDETGIEMIIKTQRVAILPGAAAMHLFPC